jgi:hypothetical protein
MVLHGVPAVSEERNEGRVKELLSTWLLYMFREFDTGFPLYSYRGFIFGILMVVSLYT